MATTTARKRPARPMSYYWGVVKDMDDSQKLRRAPNIGQIDPLFEGRAKTYRSVIVNGLNKILYYVEDDTVHIAAFWDTRREPTNQASQTK